MRKFSNWPVIPVLCYFLIRAGNAAEFNFIADDEVIATIQVNLTDMPAANLDDIGLLTFTERGDELFGFGRVYQGEFDSLGPENFPRFTIGRDGGLAGNNADNVHLISFGDIDPPPSSRFPNPLVGFSVRAADSLPDSLGIAFLDSSTQSGNGVFILEGQFLPVPEPGMSLWCVLALTAAGARARRRRTRTNSRWADKSVVDAHSPPIRLMNAAGLLECVE